MSYNYDECVKSIQEHRRRAYANAGDATTTAADGAAAAITTKTTSTPDLEALQQSMDGFATLSKHCPMTPLLWMQYAHDTEVLMEGYMMLESVEGGGSEQQLQQMQAKKSALESSTGILELALAEFPGCALLHLYYLESLADYVYHSEGVHQLNTQHGAVGMEVDDRGATHHKLSTAFGHAYESVGRGTHVNEGLLVSEIYRLHGSFLLFGLSSVGTKGNSETNAILQQISTLFKKWSKTPMGEGANDEMIQDMEYLWEEASSLLLSLCDGEQQKLKQKQDLEQQKLALWATIDGERKKTSALTNVLSSYENGIDVAMSNEGIALPRLSLFSQQQDEPNGNDLGKYLQPLKRNSAKWNQIQLGDTNRFLLGLGGSETSRAFLKAISSLQRIYQDVKKSSKGGNTERPPLEEYVATYKYSVINSLYERAVSECPTAESILVSYLNFLRGEWTRLHSKLKGQKPILQGEALYSQQQQKEELLSALQSTTQRAIRNCPYSGTLFEIRMTTLGMISVSNLEPDDITAVLQEATEYGFLNHNREAMLHLRLVAILVVKRRLMSLVSLGTTTSSSGLGKDYDEGEEIGIMSVANNKKSTNGAVMYQSLNPTAMEEVQDLLEDIRDMYDEADTYLFKSHSTWFEGKVSFWKHRALTEAYMLCPIGLAIKKANNDDEMAEEDEAVADKEALKCFEKMVKAQKPSHPDSWREYIRYVSASHLYLKGNANSQPDGIATASSTLRKTRGLYHRAISYTKKAGQEVATVPVQNNQSWMGKGIDSALLHRDYDAALSDLCREYLEFERTAGSEDSFSQAEIQVRSKLALWNPALVPAVALAAPAPNNDGELHGKRKLEGNNGASVPANGSFVMTESHEQHGEEGDDTQSRSKRTKVQTNLKQPKKTDGVHKVCIGKMEYPAHPFTIHVSKLNKDTQDMDLVDAFCLEFGGIVHAKILREKRTGKGGHHFHGESKCAGLIQFEERLSVENALQKDGEFEVGGKKIKIQRSHLPAVGLVPAGMHRVNPKGEGKISKRNKLKKGSKMKVDTTGGMDVEEEETANGKQGNTGGNQHKKKINVAAESPSSLSFSVLSFKPRGMRKKPTISLDSKKK